ncbi:hypothetical protein DH2020_006306 [Rehmannia glutinosa]|uniref:Mitochondrial protein n=1 Tax=Rehmannia glutinosa TaxID=99300 RepID=A0ABR0XIM2_REHGL
MQGKFEMSMIGELTFFLEIQVKQMNDGTFISQTKYTRDLMKKFDMKEKSSVKIPMNTSIKMDMDAYGKAVDQTRYRALIGSLLYLTASKPDITFVVGISSRFTSNPSKEHGKELKRVLRYFKFTINYGLYYNRGSSTLECYSDANWAADKIDSRSTSGWLFTIGGAIIVWASKRQTCVALSSLESEYIPVSIASKGIV